MILVKGRQVLVKNGKSLAINNIGIEGCSILALPVKSTSLKIGWRNEFDSGNKVMS